MIGMLCTGCRIGMDMGILNFAKNNHIPVIIMRGTAFEDASYKFDIMKINPNSKKITSFILGYLLHIIRNPKWILNSTCLITQIKEFYGHYYRIILNRKKDQLKIEPFGSYIRWRENEVISTIENELKWKKHPHTESTWRGDCDIALLKLYLYKRTLGFNDKDDGLSSLIRDAQINRQEALERLKAAGEIPEEVIKKIFYRLGLAYANLEIALRKSQEHRNLIKNLQS